MRKEEQRRDNNRHADSAAGLLPVLDAVDLLVRDAEFRILLLKGKCFIFEQRFALVLFLESGNCTANVHRFVASQSRPEGRIQYDERQQHDRNAALEHGYTSEFIV